MIRASVFSWQTKPFFNSSLKSGCCDQFLIKFYCTNYKICLPDVASSLIMRTNAKQIGKSSFYNTPKYLRLDLLRIIDSVAWREKLPTKLSLVKTCQNDWRDQSIVFFRGAAVIVRPKKSQDLQRRGGGKMELKLAQFCVQMRV